MTPGDMAEGSNSWDSIYQGLCGKMVPWETESRSNLMPPLSILYLFCEYLKEGRILDLGCGRGKHSLFLKQRGYTPVGIDISRVAIAEAKRRVESVEFQVCDALSLPFQDGYFDGVIDIGVFHYIKKSCHDQYVGEIRRVLPKGGVYGFFTFSEEDSNCESPDCSNMSRLGVPVHFSSDGYLYELFKSCFSVKELRKLSWESKTSPSRHSVWYGIGIAL